MRSDFSLNTPDDTHKRSRRVGGGRFMAAWGKYEFDAARHRQKREATRLGKLLSAGMRVETYLGISALISCL